MRYHLTPVIMAIINKSGNDAGEDVEKQECFYSVSGAVCNCGRQRGDSSRIQSQKYHLTQQSHDWEYTQRNISHSVIKTQVDIWFIAALFTIVKTWNQLKCPSVIDWIKKMWHKYTMEYYAAIKKIEFMAFAGTCMKLKTIILSKLIQKQKTKHQMF